VRSLIFVPRAVPRFPREKSKAVSLFRHGVGTREWLCKREQLSWRLSDQVFLGLNADWHRNLRRAFEISNETSQNEQRGHPILSLNFGTFEIAAKNIIRRPRFQEHTFRQVSVRWSWDFIDLNKCYAGVPVRT